MAEIRSVAKRAHRLEGAELLDVVRSSEREERARVRLGRDGVVGRLLLGVGDEHDAVEGGERIRSRGGPSNDEEQAGDDEAEEPHPSSPVSHDAQLSAQKERTPDACSADVLS